MHMHFDKLKLVRARSLGVAIIGTGFPVVAGIACVKLLGYDAWPDGVAAGVALAPTSVGIALKLLTESKQMTSEYGQVIITSAFIDDVFSLILLVILINLAEGSASVLRISWPIVASCAFVAFGTWLGTFHLPKLFDRILKRIKDNPLLSWQPRDEVHLSAMFVLLIFYGWVGSLIGSHVRLSFV